MGKNWRPLLGLFVVLSLLAAACGGGGSDSAGGEGEADEGMSGRIAVSGSSTVEPISALNAELFSEVAPEVQISVDGPGTSDGFELFCNGETDISDASRAIEQEEIDACAEQGIEPIELQVAVDGLSVITNSENDQVECLDFMDLYALLGPESQGFENWSDANALGEELGAGNTPYPDAPLDVTGPGEESGTFDSFVEIVLEGTAEERGQEPAPRPDYTSSANDNVIIQGIQGSPTSLGWVGFAFAVENTDTIRPLPIAAEPGGDCVEPTPETISDGSYPIARPLFIYVNKAEAEETPAIAEFVDFYLSDEGLASVSEVGYVDLDSATLEETRANWENRTVVGGAGGAEEET